MKTKTKPFGEMTKAQQRVAVAKDAIQQIEAGQTIPSDCCGYVDAGYGKRINQETLTAGLECRCCGIGAALVSLVRLDNKFDGERHVGPCSTEARLMDVFAQEQISLVESAFEGWGGRHEMISEFPYPKDRAIAIFQNIIKNNGKFIP